VATALGYALIPTLEQRAIDAGQRPSPSPFRHALHEHGWQWLLYELAAMVLFGLLSMALDRVRSLRKEREPRRNS
jgi:hypothetical protein